MEPHENRVNELEKELVVHETQCEERWKTNFTELQTIKKAIVRIETSFDERMDKLYGLIFRGSGTIIALLFTALIAFLVKQQ
jgi:ribosomal protein L29